MSGLFSAPKNGGNKNDSRITINISSDEEDADDEDLVTPFLGDSQGRDAIKAAYDQVISSGVSMKEKIVKANKKAHTEIQRVERQERAEQKRKLDEFIKIVREDERGRVAKRTKLSREYDVKKMKEMRQESRKRESEINELKKSFEEKSKLKDQETRKKDQELQFRLGRINDLHSLNKVLKKEKDELEIRVANLTQIKEEHQKILDDVKDQCQFDVETHIEAHEETTKKFNKTFQDQLRMEEERNEQATKALREEKDAYKAKWKQEVQKNQKLEDRVAGLLEDVESDIQKHDIQRDGAPEVSAQRDNEFKEIESMIVAIKKERDCLEKKLSEEIKKNEDLQDNINRIEASLDNLAKEKDKQEIELKKLAQQSENCTMELSQQVKEHEEALRQLEKEWEKKLDDALVKERRIQMTALASEIEAKNAKIKTEEKVKKEER